MKKELILKIKKLISEIGSTSTGEMQSNYSQMYKSIGKDHFMLVEGYNADNISVVEYVHEVVTHEFYALYEDLKAWQLKEILAELKEYAGEMDLLNN